MIAAVRISITKTLVVAVSAVVIACTATLSYYELYPPDSYAHAVGLGSFYQPPGALDELRSHLPPETQMAMGLKPFVSKTSFCFDPCFDTAFIHGWTYEHYLRMDGRDVTSLCYAEYKKFASSLGWIKGNGYWIEFMNMCKHRTAKETSMHLATQIPRGLSDDCTKRISQHGWIVGDDGRFYHPDYPGFFSSRVPMSPGSFVIECLPDPPPKANLYTGHLDEPTRYYYGYAPEKPPEFLGYSSGSIKEDTERYKPVELYPERYRPYPYYPDSDPPDLTP